MRTRITSYNVCYTKLLREFAALSAEDFVKNILIDKLNLGTLVVGDDHKFGKGRQGDYEHLTLLAESYNFV